MREVAVHLEHELRVPGEHPVEAGDVRAAEALLLLAVEHVDEWVRGGELVGELAGSVRRAVVDHEHAVALPQDPAESLDHAGEILALVVGGKADGRAHRRAYDRWDGRAPAE